MQLGGGACRALAGSGPHSTWTSCWDGDCFTATVTGSSGVYQWQSQTCLPLQPAPRSIRLVRVPDISGRVVSNEPSGPGLTAYAGLVSPQTAHVVVHYSNGGVRRLTPGLVAGRKYIGLAMSKQVLVTKIELFDAARRSFATVLRVPASCGVQPIPACAAPAATR